MGVIPHGMPGVVTEFSVETFMVMGWWTKAVECVCLKLVASPSAVCALKQ